MSWRIVTSDRSGNEKKEGPERYLTAEQAIIVAKTLMWRCLAISYWTVVESSDPVNVEANFEDLNALAS